MGHLKKIPLNYLFWATEAAYVVNIIDESVLNDGFIAGVKKYIWTGYSGEKFFFTNAILLICIAVGIILYERYGNSFVVAPLMWVVERSLNGLWHIWWTVHFMTYSPGLVTSILFWIILYFIIRDNYRQGDFTRVQLIKATILAVVFECILLSSLWIGKALLG